MKEPLVSVIVPVYRSLPYLEDCLFGICSQTYGNLEILCIDDGSPDESLSFLESYAKKEPRLRLFHQENAGQGSARNLGIRMARGEWLCFVDADDSIHPEMISSLLREALRQDARGAFCGLRRGEAFPEEWKEEGEEAEGKEEGPGKGKAKGKAGGEEIPAFELLSLDEEGLIRLYRDEDIHYWICCGALYRKEIPAGLPYPEGQAFEDNAISLAWNHQCGRIAQTQRELYFYRQNPGSTTAGGFSRRKTDYLLALQSQMAYARKQGMRRLERLLGARYLVDLAYFARLAREAGDEKTRRELSARCLRFWLTHPGLALEGRGRRILKDLMP